MPSFCEYRNCHNLASSTWMGYCNQYHYERAQLQEAKERVKRLEEAIHKKENKQGKKEINLKK